MERTRALLPILQCLRNRQLWGKMFNGWASIILVGRLPTHVFERDSMTGVNDRDEIFSGRRISIEWEYSPYVLVSQCFRPQPYRACLGRSGKDGDRFNSCQVIYSQFGLAIHQNDHQARRRFVEWAQNEIAVVPDFHTRILFSDEAHFWLNGYVNKQNGRIWSEAIPQVYVETPLHPEKLTVWCALWTGGIIGPYFFKNNEGHNVTVNGDRYRAMITNFFIPELNNYDVQELWFQQDGATCHTARATIDLLKDTFGESLILRFGPVNWPPRSCDLTPLDYFLWGDVKLLVYADKPQPLDHLEDNIRRVIAYIRPQMLEKVIENWTSRLDYIRASRDSHTEIIFKM
ncbi:transposase [Trichonephila clavipes]|nr:transposase [Trichonephila clavipes]